MARRPRPPEMAPLTAADLAPVPDFDTNPPDVEPPPREAQVPAPVPLPSVAIAGSLEPGDDREAFGREVRRWD